MHDNDKTKITKIFPINCEIAMFESVTVVPTEAM